MNSQDFHRLCYKLSDLEARVKIFKESERGDKARLKKVRVTLRDIVGLKNLQTLTKRAQSLNKAWFREQRTDFGDNSVLEEAAKQDRKDAETKYRKFCEDFYKTMFPPPDPVLSPEAIQRLQAVTEQIKEAKQKHQLAKHREQQLRELEYKLSEETSEAYQAYYVLVETAEMIKKGKL
jgi:hypothetical protein